MVIDEIFNDPKKQMTSLDLGLKIFYERAREAGASEEEALQSARYQMNRSTI